MATPDDDSGIEEFHLDAIADADPYPYWYADADVASEAARTLQNDTFRDRLVQRFGSQLRSSKVSRESAS